MQSLNDGDQVIVSPDLKLIFKLEDNVCSIFNMDETHVQDFYTPAHKPFKEVVEDKVDEIYYRSC